MPLRSLLHLHANESRLIRRQFDNGAGGKCIFGLLTEPFSPEQQINTRPALIHHYGDDEESEHYAPARALVRLWDARFNDPIVIARYGCNSAPLTKRVLLRVLRQAIRRRQAKLRRHSRVGTAQSGGRAAARRSTPSSIVSIRL
jgi:hypothetical protein